MTRNKNAYVCPQLAQPRWHILNVNQESDLQRLEAEFDKPKMYQNPYLISYLQKAIRGQRMELKHINKITGIFN